MANHNDRAAGRTDRDWVMDRTTIDSDRNGSIDYYEADLTAATSYYSYGAVAQSFNADSIRYAFNGQRRSFEISNTAQTALYWEYDGDVGRRWNLDPVTRPFESPNMAFSGNPIRFIDPDGNAPNDHVYLTFGGKEVHKIKDGSSKITPVIISEKNQKTFNATVAKGNASIESLKGYGITYDLNSISKFYFDNKNKFMAKTINLEPIPTGASISVDGKPVKQLYAEAVVNTVLKDGVVSVGNNPAVCIYDFARNLQDAGDEPGRAGSAHLHPVAKETKLDITTGGLLKSSSFYNIHGGHPSGIEGESSGDYQEHERSFQANPNRQAGNNVRSIMVDRKNIFLYNSSPNQTITIPR